MSPLNKRFRFPHTSIAVQESHHLAVYLLLAYLCTRRPPDAMAFLSKVSLFVAKTPHTATNSNVSRYSCSFSSTSCCIAAGELRVQVLPLRSGQGLLTFHRPMGHPCPSNKRLLIAQQQAFTTHAPTVDARTLSSAGCCPRGRLADPKRFGHFLQRRLPRPPALSRPPGHHRPWAGAGQRQRAVAPRALPGRHGGLRARAAALREADRRFPRDNRT